LESINHSLTTLELFGLGPRARTCKGLIRTENSEDNSTRCNEGLGKERTKAETNKLKKKVRVSCNSKPGCLQTQITTSSATSNLIINKTYNKIFQQVVDPKVSDLLA